MFVPIPKNSNGAYAPDTRANESWTLRLQSGTMGKFRPGKPWESPVSDRSFFMTRKPETHKTALAPLPAAETDQQRFERILARDHFKPLKAVLDNLRVDFPVMQGALITTNSYAMFLSKVGFRIVVVKQLHEQDCYTRLGPKGGIRAVLPLHDAATYSTMVTLVNFDSTLTTTANSVDFYDDQLAEFKVQLMNRSGNAK
jgi:hypothetical protein